VERLLPTNNRSSRTRETAKRIEGVLLASCQMQTETWNRKKIFSDINTQFFSKLHLIIVNLNNETLPFCSEPKYLGVTLDRSLTYRRHFESLYNLLADDRAVYNLLSDATQQLVMTRVMQLLVAAEAANSPPVTLRESTCRAAVLSNLQRQIAWTLSRTRCAQCRCRVVVPDRGGIPSQGGISWVQARISTL